jgi:hypothetical protein
MTTTPADLRARILAAWDRADPDGVPERVAAGPVPVGWAVWRLGGPGGPCTALPALLPSAPLAVRLRYRWRVVANLTGTCPACGGVAGLIGPTPDGPLAAWALLPVTLGITHDDGCPTVFGEADRDHLDPRALGGAHRSPACPPRRKRRPRGSR